MSTLEVNTITPQSGTTITIGGSGDTVSLGSGATQSGFGGVNTPAFVAYLDANQGVSDNTHTKLTVTNEAFDTDNAFASSTFTVPSGKAGKYLFVGKARMVNTVGYIVLDFYKNGSNAGIHFRSQSYSTTYESVTITAILDLSVGDYIELYGLQSSGSPNDITGKLFQGFRLVE